MVKGWGGFMGSSSSSSIGDKKKKIIYLKGKKIKDTSKTKEICLISSLDKLWPISIKLLVLMVRASLPSHNQTTKLRREYIDRY